MSVIVFDIETGPLPADQLEACVVPFDASTMPHPGEFDPESVKYGNTKDEEKRAAKLEAAREKHASEVEKWAEKIEQARADHWAAAVEKSPLDACTGRVLAIGWWREGAKPQIADGGGDETELIRSFWARYETCRAKNIRMVGHNIHGFDLPFLMRRSWILGVPVPDGLLKQGRYWCDTFVDTMQHWACGMYGHRTSLDAICRGMGIGSKNGSGAMFHRLWFGTAEEKQAAIAYLVNDLELTAEAAKRMKVL